MKLEQLRHTLLAAARTQAPSDAVPYAFEKRIVARLSTLSIQDGWSAWAVALWRGAAACIAVALLCGAWAFSPLNTSRASTDLSQDLEHVILASADEADSSW